MEIKPSRALKLLTAINYFNYIDRYVLAATLVAIKAELQLSDFESGLLVTAFMIPYVFTSPLFGWLGDTRNRSKILGFGAALWSFASMLTGFSPGFVVLAASRFLLGIGESAFTVISTPFLTEHYSSEKRGRVLSIFSSALPVGAALGFVLGGIIGQKFGWRNAFYAVGIPGLILAALIWKLPEPRKAPAVREKFDFKAVFGLLKLRSYLYTVIGYCAYSFTVGGAAYWFPTYMQRTFGVDQAKASTVFGGCTVVAGLAGTLLGGFWGDNLAKKYHNGHVYLSAYTMLLGLPIFLYAILGADDMTTFTAAMFFCLFLFFISTSPISVATLESSPLKMRTSAMALCIFACHILGDGISSPIIGYISDQTGSLKYGMLACAPVIVICGLFWIMAARRPRDNFG